MVDWRTACRGVEEFDLDQDGVVVRFAGGRRHRVTVSETPETIELHAIVAKPSRVRDDVGVAERLWVLNRGSQLVCFKLDRYQRVVATAWCPKQGATFEELRTLIHRLASESDRVEMLLTGVDVE
ncbi:MAG: hypothetical protein KC586_11580 [Myxococcales bacterium]|nr:hypothetical protein [Myxococcales bacterium]